jgi:hypothetical protein
LEQQTESNHLFRIYAYLSVSGNDMLRRLGGYLGNVNYSQKVTRYLKEFDEFKDKFNNAWRLDN